MSAPEVTPQRPIILASGSEIRKQMLGDAGIVFSVQASELNESKLKKISEEEPFQDRVIKLASAKAKVISKKNMFSPNVFYSDPKFSQDSQNHT